MRCGWSPNRLAPNTQRGSEEAPWRGVPAGFKVWGMPRLPLRIPLLTASLCLVAAAPAGAVIHGEPLAEAQVPWFANLGCGGSLVAPDRVLTAAHCVGGEQPSGITVAGQVHTVKGISLAPGWRRANGPSNYLNDVALVILDEPAVGVPLVALGGTPDPQMKIIGRGFVNAPGSGRPESENWHAVLRQATLRTMTDRACAKAFRHARGNAGERFDGSRMICAIDPDGRAPLSSGCNGDSGGPLMAGTYEAPRVLGIVSYGGAGCGADHLPSVFAEVERYRSFILTPNPVLAPRTTGVAALRRSGRRLTCEAPPFTGATKVRYSWSRSRRGSFRVIGHGRGHKLRRADRGTLITCRAEGSNAGGHASAFSKQLRIPRGRPRRTARLRAVRRATGMVGDRSFQGSPHPAAESVAAGQDGRCLGGGSGHRRSTLGLLMSGTDADDVPGQVATLKRGDQPGAGVELPASEAMPR